MDVSIAVSLIRGQMGTVVERAVNTAVETVLAEMLKVVGVKFEELKAQVSSLKKELTATQREKNLKDKENDKIRAMLRYAELKLKYYRQGVEEEMQQRSNAAGHQEGAPALRITHGNRSRAPPVRLTTSSSMVVMETPGSAPSLDVEVHMETPPTHTLKEGTASGQQEGEESDECVWAGLSLQPQASSNDEPIVLDHMTCDLPGPSPPSDRPPSPDSRPQADSSTLTPMVKQEEEFQQEEEEVICIKEEPEEPQEVMATLLPDFDVQPGPLPGSEEARTVWTPPPSTGQQSHMGQRVTFSGAAHSYFLSQQQQGSGGGGGPMLGAGGFRTGGGAAVLAGGPGGLHGAPPPRPPGNSRPWGSKDLSPPRPPGSSRSWGSKDLSLYEEYKLRRNELRRRSINRRREMEKALPQPLLADLVRERREKTRLRVARWRAKRKLQACLLTQAQVGGGADQHHRQQQLRAMGAPSSVQPRRSSPMLPHFSSMTSSSNAFPASLSFSSAPSSSFSSASSSLLSAQAPTPEQHSANQHAVTSSSSSSSSSSASHPQLSLSQAGISLTDADFFSGL